MCIFGTGCYNINNLHLNYKDNAICINHVLHHVPNSLALHRMTSCYGKVMSVNNVILYM